MTIGIFFPHPFKGSLGSTRRVNEISKTLAKELDVKINLYTPYEKKGFLNNNVSIKPIPNVALTLRLNDTFYNSAKTLYYNKYFAKNFLAFAIKRSANLFSHKMVEVMRKDGISCLQAEHDFALLPAIDVARRLNVPIIVDLHNITAEELVATGVLAYNDKAYRKIQAMLGEALSQTDYICVVNQYMANYVFSVFGIERKRIIVVPPAARTGYERHSRALTSNKIVYAGMVDNREHVDLFIRGLQYTIRSFKNTKSFITNRGKSLLQIKHLAKRLGVRPHYFWFSRTDDLFKFLTTCSVGVLPSSNNEARKLGTPIKLFDYMSTGLPIVANKVGKWAEIIEKEKIGILTSDDPNEFGAAIKQLLTDRNLQAEMACNALQAAKYRYSWQKSIEPLKKIYKSLIH